MKEKIKRAISLEGIDKKLKLSKVTAIHIDHTNKEFIFFEKLKDDTWSLVYTSSTIPEIKDLKAIKIIRDDSSTEHDTLKAYNKAIESFQGSHRKKVVL